MLVTARVRPVLLLTLFILTTFFPTGCQSESRKEEGISAPRTSEISESTKSALVTDRGVEERDAPGGEREIITIISTGEGMPDMGIPAGEIKRSVILGAKEYISQTPYGLLICRPVMRSMIPPTGEVRPAYLVMIEVDGERYAINGTARDADTMRQLGLKDGMKVTAGPIMQMREADARGDFDMVEQGLNLAKGISPSMKEKASVMSNETPSPKPLPMPKPAKSTQKNLASQVKILQARLISTTAENGVELQKAVVRWRNKGPEPIGSLYARIDFFDANGSRMLDSADDYLIWMADDESEFVRAGQVYDEPEKEGFNLFTAADMGIKAMRVKVVPVRANKETMKEYLKSLHTVIQSR